MNNVRFISIFAVHGLLIFAAPACAQNDHNSPPINYDTQAPQDAISRLAVKLKSNQTTLTWDEKHGWLPDLLQELRIPSSSQTLVFSKTSQQHAKISPTNPRAIYFNDENYVGYVPGGDFIEIGVVDPQQGAIFYTLDRQYTDQPVFRRDTTNCLSCHDTNKTDNVPGFLVRSVFPKPNGHPEFRYGTTTTNHTTKFADRFGGWYVTGKHGDMRSRGNVFVDKAASNEESALDREAGANQTILPDRIRRQKYIEPTSDIVALMLLEHQTKFHNLVTKASYETRKALYYQREMNRILERDANFKSDSTKRRIESVANELVRYLLFCDEFELTSPISGSQQFQHDFSATARRDDKGRSLRDLDLKTRLLKYPCSYLIYTDSFCSLPKPVLSLVIKKMRHVLADANPAKEFKHIGIEHGKVIIEILKQTHPLFLD